MASGCTHFQNSTLIYHLENSEHKQDTQEKLLYSDFHETCEHTITTNDEAILTAMKMVYFIVKTDAKCRMLNF